MIEKRRSKRLDIKLTLSISSLFRQDNEAINIDSPIVVTDISKNGIGFESENFLPIGYYFNAEIQLGSQDSKLYCVVKIVRSHIMEGSDNLYHYGCEYVGMAPVLDFIFDDYEEELNRKNGEE